MKIQPFSKKFVASVTAGLAASLMLGSTTPANAQITPTLSQVLTNITRAIQNNTSLPPAVRTQLLNLLNRFTRSPFTMRQTQMLAVVIDSISEEQVASIIAGSENQAGIRIAGAGIPVELTKPISSPTGVLLASADTGSVGQLSEPTSPQEAVLDLHNTFNKAFIAAGVSSSDADKNATKLVTALAATKSGFTSNGAVNVRKINQLARSIEPARAALPGMLAVLSNNPSAETFQQIQVTVAAVESVATVVKTVDNSL